DVQISHGAFAILPIYETHRPEKYAVVTSCLKNKCFIGITSGQSSVNLTITLSSLSQVQYGDKSFNSSIPIIENLK
ncbi:hypothetical protein BgiBS90_000001, partial [Biomphalaria glabrata]